MVKCKRIVWVVMVALILSAGMNQISFSQETEDSIVKTEDSATKDKDQEAKGMTLWQVVKAGGWIMLIIGLCSIIAMWLVIEHFIHLRIKKIIPDDFVKKIYAFLQQRRYHELYDFCKATPGLISNMLIAAMEKKDHGIKVVQQDIAESGEREESRLQRKISYLSMIATLSPMLGLLGTVLGMIQAFNVIAFSAGLGKPTLLAAGVSKALVTTAAGLIVAIPAMGFYFFFRNRINLIMERIEDIMTKLIESLLGGSAIAAGAETVQQKVKPDIQEGEQK